jgi:hypothetical protein
MVMVMVMVMVRVRVRADDLLFNGVAEFASAIVREKGACC